MNFSLQLYSARNFTPWEQVFKSIAALGYKQVEGYGGVYDDPAAMRALLDEHDLTMPSGHFSLDALENDLSTVLTTASTLGCRSIFCPHITEDLRAPDLPGWQAFAKRLDTIGKKVRASGYRFGWHNHDFEFSTCEDGTVPMQVILDSAPDIDWEMDIAWIARGGSDPASWIASHGSRVTAIHVKDIAASGECTDEDGWADVGHGTLDWPTIMKLVSQHTRAELFIAEHDNPSDHDRFAQRSIAAMQSFN